MAQRIALLIASLAAAGVLAVALAAAGFAPIPPAAPAQPAAEAALQVTPDPAGIPAPSLTTQIDRVYVRPAPPPKVVHVVKTVRATPAPVVIVRQSSTASGTGGGSQDGGDAQGGND